MRAGFLTMAPTCKKGHPVDGNGHCTMLVVEVVDMVGCTEGRGHSGSHSRARKHQQCQREHQSEEEGRTSPHHRWHRSRLRRQHQTFIWLQFGLCLLPQRGGAWDEQKAPPPHTTQTGKKHLKEIQGPLSPALQTGEEKKRRKLWKNKKPIIKMILV